MELVTGRAGSPHITAQQDRQLHQGIWGKEAYILNTGNMLAPEVQSSNKILIKDGALMFQGALFSVKAGTTDEITINNGNQGMQRKDLVVARYTYDSSQNIESAEWVVIQGEPAASNPVAPEGTSGDIQAGDAVVDCPFMIVNLDGINVTGVDIIPEVLQTIPELIGEMDSKNFLRENDYEMTYLTVHTSYDNRVEALKNSLINNSSLWKQGLTATYIVSDNSDDRGMAIIMKKVNPDGALRLAFQYLDYWGTNEFWCYTNAGWEKK